MSDSPKGGLPEGTTTFKPLTSKNIAVQVPSAPIDGVWQNKRESVDSGTNMSVTEHTFLGLFGRYVKGNVYSPTKGGSVFLSASTAPGEMLHTLTVSSTNSSDTTEISLATREAIMRILQVASQLYHDVLVSVSELMCNGRVFG